jgi:hypothetical protein
MATVQSSNRLALLGPASKPCCGATHGRSGAESLSPTNVVFDGPKAGGSDAPGLGDLDNGHSRTLVGGVLLALHGPALNAAPSNP